MKTVGNHSPYETEDKRYEKKTTTESGSCSALSYDITDPEHPFWVLILYSAQLDDLQEAIKRENSDPYEVRIDGKTGEVLMSYNAIGKTDEDGFYY